MAKILELALLGNPEVRLAGQPLAKLRSIKSYALLYYLVATRRTQARPVLAGLFWGAEDEYYARRNFNRTLSDLTQYVGDYLVIERQTVAMSRQQPYWLDFEELENAAAIAPTADTLASLVAAANRYRGDFLEGFYVQDAPEFEQWVLTERTRLRTTVRHLLHTLAVYHDEQGDLSQAIDYARRLLQLEPWYEEAHRHLILWLAQSGQRSAALAQFELCRQALRSELAVEPDAATVELVARIRAGKIDRVTSDKVTSDKVTSDKVMVNHPVTPSPSHPLTQSPPHPVPLPSASLRAEPQAEASVAPLPPHNLPPQRTPFVGRATELDEITRLLLAEEECRLLTLVGPGGMGKTRLALKAAEQIVTSGQGAARFVDGVFFLPLEHVGEAQGLVAALIARIGETSGFPLRADAPLLDQLLSFLRNKAMLLVLDNFEHLIAYADLCSTLLAAAPRLKLLVTTRETLALTEAWFYSLPGLSFPQELPPHDTRTAGNGGGPEEYDAVRLFVQCARRTQPAFVFDNERSHVWRICTLVEGMPLGIELAAAWLKVMTCAQIAQQVAQGLDFLSARYQNLPARHQSMRVVMEHSWALLAPEEREVIARLSIFRGRFHQAAAKAVTGASLFTLATLVEKALLRLTPAGHYQLHELPRHFAEQTLPQVAKTALRDAHAIYYAHRLQEHQPHIFTGGHRQVWTAVGEELDNIRHAWEWLIVAIETHRMELPAPRLLRQMAEVLANYYLFQSLWLPGQELFQRACQIFTRAGWGGPDALAGEVTDHLTTFVHLQLLNGLFHHEMGHYRKSLAMVEPMLTLCRRLALRDDLLLGLLIYGRTQMRRGAHTEAAAVLREAITLGQQLNQPHRTADAFLTLSMDANNAGLYQEAQAYLRQGLSLCQTLGYRPWIARGLTSLGTSYLRQNAYQEAQPYYEEALKMAQEEGDQLMVLINTSNLGAIQHALRHYQRALDYYQSSLSMARSMGEARWIAANLNGLAGVYLDLPDLAAAERTLQEALVVGHRSDSAPDLLGSVALFGQLFARRRQTAMALKALLFIEQHPATLARDKLYGQPLLAKLRHEADTAHVANATAWAATQSLDAVVGWLQQMTPLMGLPSASHNDPDR